MDIREDRKWLNFSQVCIKIDGQKKFTKFGTNFWNLCVKIAITVKKMHSVRKLHSKAFDDKFLLEKFEYLKFFSKLIFYRANYY